MRQHDCNEIRRTATEKGAAVIPRSANGSVIGEQEEAINVNRFVDIPRYRAQIGYSLGLESWSGEGPSRLNRSMACILLSVAAGQAKYGATHLVSGT